MDEDAADGDSCSGGNADADGDSCSGGNADADGDLISAILRLDELVETLREQCPWDREQTHTSLRRYLLEETYETLEALDARTDSDRDGGGGGSEGSHIEDLDRHLCEELGDLLYQVWFQAHLASERDAFDMADVAREVHTKLVARHPHVFGDVEARDADAVRGMWDVLKLREKGRDSVMDGIPETLPALLQAVKVQKRAAAAGLIIDDWYEREFAETERALADLRADGSERGFGEFLLAAVELGRRLKIDPEDALRSATERAQRRYRTLEQDSG
ncbi:MAG: nucleoside triphosphate pyrophosphohydrolase [Acidimicrobiia bacterium]|nr:nucleoside triphosphate pyrophosphohydrolase [Acidimicrobiia bacterium]